METGRLDGLIKDYGLDAHRDAILAAARPALYLRLGEAGQGTPGESRIGGIPDLPDSMAWPADPLLGRLRSFLLQINLGDLPAFAENPFPRRGMLYLFADENEDDADQLILYTGDEPVRARQPAADAEFITDWYDGLIPHRLVVEPGADIPRWATDEFYAFAATVGMEDDEDGLSDLGSALSGGSVGKLLGHVSGIGHDPRGDAYVVREVNPEWRFAYDKRRTLDMTGAANWTNLLELDSDNAVNLLIGDAGYMHVLAHAGDLRRGDFSRVWLNMESS